jgi:hypothetical protein
MSNQPPVKTPLSEPDPAAGIEASESESPAAPEPAPDPQVTALLQLLRPVAEPKVHPQAEALLPLATRIEISLDAHRLRVLQGETVLVESPLATGRALSPTPEGSFILAVMGPTLPWRLRYGHYRTRAGALLLRGVFPRIDPLPPEAVFDPIVPKGMLKLSGEDGPLIFGGEATGAATSDGSLVLPERIAILLSENLRLGLPVVIAR